jgi:hypothetical protein
MQATRAVSAFTAATVIASIDGSNVKNVLLVALCLQDILEASTLRELLPKLALHMQACLHRQQWCAAVPTIQVQHASISSITAALTACYWLPVWLP